MNEKKYRLMIFVAQSMLTKERDYKKQVEKFTQNLYDLKFKWFNHNVYLGDEESEEENEYLLEYIKNMCPSAVYIIIMKVTNEQIDNAMHFNI